MLPDKVRTTTRSITDTIGIIDIFGEVTGFAENVLMEAYRYLTDQGKTDIVLNFKNMEYMNSSGIGLLVTLFIRSSRNGHRLAAVELRSHFRRVFGLTRLQDVVPVFDTEDEAVAKFKEPK
jgi:anti-anti-sigma factor